MAMAVGGPSFPFIERVMSGPIHPLQRLAGNRWNRQSGLDGVLALYPRLGLANLSVIRWLVGPNAREAIRSIRECGRQGTVSFLACRRL